jgi:hypothetical protein
MVTRYKPTQMRGKIVVYRSLDPNERKEGRTRLAACGVVYIALLMLSWFISR